MLANPKSFPTVFPGGKYKKKIGEKMGTFSGNDTRVDFSWQPYPRAIYGSIHAIQNFRCMILPWLPSFQYTFFCGSKIPWRGWHTHTK